MIFEGTNEILRMLIALSGFKELGDQLKEVQHALRSPLKERGVLAEYGKKRMKGVITRDKLTKVHPSLAPEGEQVGKYAGIFANAAETILRKHGKKVVDREYQQERLADIVVDLYAQIAVLSRVTASIQKKGEEKAAGEIEIARWFCHHALHRMVGNLKALDRNRDALTTAISDKVYEFGGYPYDLWA
jgi:hypothetical protein